MLKMLTSNKKYSVYGFCAVSVFVGIYIGSILSVWLIQYGTLTFAKEMVIEINPFDLVSLIVNVLLVVFILRNFQRSDDVEKIEKELLVENFRKFEEDFDSFIKRAVQKSQNSTMKREEIVPRLKRFRMQFFSLLKISTKGSCVEGDASLLKENIFSIYAKLTDQSEVDGYLQFDTPSLDQLADLDYLFHNLMFEYLVKIINSDR